jgi:3-oxoacyl-[acyl-carrier-protein] synthase II
MNLAIEESSIETGDIDYINCHATSTPVGDICETNAIEKLFNEKLDKLVISGTKSMTGHLLGAAGAIEAIACIFAISEDTIPPTINTTELDEKISPDINIVLGTPLEKKINIAMSNTFGFGGQNAIAVFRRYKE